MYILGTQTTATQTVLEGGEIALGNSYRKYCKKNACGTPVFSLTNTGITLNWDGVYHITAVFVANGSDAGNIAVQMFENGVAVPSAISTQTITTPDTEIRTLNIDYFVLVDSTCVLGNNTTVAKTITFENVGVDATFSSVVVNIEKEL